MTGLSTGLYPDYMGLFSNLLNVTIREFCREDKKFGAIDPNTGNWTGMIENLNNGEADLILTSLTIFGKRPLVVDYMQPLTEASLVFCIKSKVLDC